MNPSIGALLVDASERLLGDALERLEGAGYPGLSVSDAFAVQLIESGVHTITALSAAMRMTPQAVSAIVSRLQMRGFVAKGRLARDARARILTLTSEGAHLARVIAEALRDAEKEWQDLVGETAFSGLRGALAAYVASRLDVGSAPARRRRRRVRIA